VPGAGLPLHGGGEPGPGRGGGVRYLKAPRKGKVSMPFIREFAASRAEDFNRKIFYKRLPFLEFRLSSHANGLDNGTGIV
jgi:hypothetical protein